MLLSRWVFCLSLLVLQLSTTIAWAEQRILTAEEPPANYLVDGKVSGTSVDIVKGILRVLKQNTKIEFLPWARAYQIAKTNPNIVIFTAGRSKDRIDHGFHFIGPVISRNHVLWKRKGSAITIRDLEDVISGNWTIAGVNQDWRTKLFESRGAHIVRIASHRQGIKMLLKGRVDLWISSDFEAPSVAKEANIEMGDMEIAYIIKTAPSFIMVSKDSSTEFVKSWRGAFAELQKTRFFKNTAQKWSGILDFDLGYQADKGFYILK